MRTILMLFIVLVLSGCGNTTQRFLIRDQRTGNPIPGVGVEELRHYGLFRGLARFAVIGMPPKDDCYGTAVGSTDSNGTIEAQIHRGSMCRFEKPGYQTFITSELTERRELIVVSLTPSDPESP